MSDDVLVVGGGLGGCVAALAAVRENPSARVRLLAPEEGRFDYHSGLIDVLGYTPETSSDASESRSSPWPVDNPLTALVDLPASHPYSLLGVETVREALATFDDVCPTYRGGHTEKNALVLTPSGRPTPAARYPAGMAGGLVSANEPALLVGFDQIPDFDPRLVVDALNDGLPYALTTLSVEFPLRVTEYPAGPRLATALDENVVVDESGERLTAPPEDDPTTTSEDGGGDPAEDGGGEAAEDDGGEPAEGTHVREALADLFREELDIEPRIGMPAVLGQQAHDEIRRELRKTLYARVFEVPVGPPSIPGRRLEAQLLASLAEADVAVDADCEITGFDATDDRIERVRTDEGAYDAQEFVLATGDLTTGGLVADRHGVREPVFDCHVSHPSDRSEWVAGGFLGDHQFVRFGVDVDETLHPLNSRGSVEYENLRAVGRIIGGPDYAAEQSGDGVAIATGYTAGRRVAERV